MPQKRSTLIVRLLFFFVTKEHPFALIDTCAEVHNRLVALQKELDSLWEKIEAAEEDGDDTQIARMEEKAELIEEQIEQHHELAELKGEFRELKSMVARLERVDDYENILRVAERLGKTAKVFEELLSQTKKLHQIYINGPE